MRILISIILGILITSGANAVGGRGQSCTDYTDMAAEIENWINKAATGNLSNTDMMTLQYMGTLLPNTCSGDDLVCKRGICETGKCGKKGATYLPNGGECCYGYYPKNGYCEQCPISCNNCTGSEEYLPRLLENNKGIVTKDKAVCFCGECKHILINKCTVGYYQSGTQNGMIKCEKCPIDELTGIQSTTRKDSAAKSITDCFIPATTSGTDDSGDYKFNIDCNYI